MNQNPGESVNDPLQSSAQRADEVFDVVDAFDRVVGRATRGEVHARGLLHRAVHVFVTDDTGRVLVQRRSAHKDVFPNRWTSSVSGHVDAGETYLAAARREVREELGWDGPCALRPLGEAEAGPATENEFVAVYATVLPGPFAPPPAEVAELCWMTPAGVDALVLGEPAAVAPSFAHLWLRFGARAATPPTARFWAEAQPVFTRILAHPFLAGLVDGTLPVEAFRRYVVQDALYLRGFARGLAQLGARSGDEDVLALFCAHATNTIAVERSLHAGFLEAWGHDPADTAQTEPSPACSHYAAFLGRHAGQSPYPEALAAFLPCYRVYLEVGRALAGRSSPNPLYARWIATYAGDGFATVVREIETEADRVLSPLEPSALRSCLRAYLTACELEWGFWDGAWR